MWASCEIHAPVVLPLVNDSPFSIGSDSEVFTAVRIHIGAIRVKTPCSLVSGYRRYGGNEGSKFLRKLGDHLPDYTVS